MVLGMTLGRLREEMSSAEMAAWIAFNRIDPIGEMRGFLRGMDTAFERDPDRL